MSGFKKSSIPRQSSYNSLYINPLTDLNRHSRSCSDGGSGGNSTDAAVLPLGVHVCRKSVTGYKENAVSIKPKNSIDGDKENAMPVNGFPCGVAKQFSDGKKPYLTDRALKPSSLQLCMQMSDTDLNFGSKIWDPIESENKSSVNIWDYSDSEAAPASSWSTLPSRSLLCRPLPVDVGRCTCVIVKEASPEGLDGGNLYSLYTNEGKGRQDRKLAVAYHRRRIGRSQFVVAQNMKGIFCNSDDSFIGILAANLMGSKYHVWDQGYSQLNSLPKQGKPPLAVVS
ncbi:hypothetical protein U1Q18_027094 [Sarracenia purpurea var. burkii]